MAKRQDVAIEEIVVDNRKLLLAETIHATVEQYATIYYVEYEALGLLTMSKTLDAAIERMKREIVRRWDVIYSLPEAQQAHLRARIMEE